MSVNLFLVRHAEPSVTGVLLGQCDPGLSERGRAQAAGLLAGVELEMVYSSPLRRALETAVLMARGARIEVIDDLREITFGAWDGRKWEDIEKRDPELAASKLRDWRGVTLEGAEAWSDFAARVQRALERIAKGPRPAAVVAHAAVLNVIAQVDLEYGGVHEM